MKTVQELNRRAAGQAAGILIDAVDRQGCARVVAATGSSQLGFLDELIGMPGIDWSRIELFHLDEYLGVPASHPASFCRFIHERIVSRTGLTRHHLIDGMGAPAVVMADLTTALRRAPVDLAITGVGENGHLAFNEPPANFETGEAFAVVALDEISRRQQVGEGWFTRIEDVPTHAITMTVPEILKAQAIVCLAHGRRKARAIASCFNGAPTPAAPASILAVHPHATVYLDVEAAALLEPTVLTSHH